MTTSGDLRCMWGYGIPNDRCPAEAAWILRVKPAPCGHAWKKDRPTVQLYCDYHMRFKLKHIGDNGNFSCAEPECLSTKAFDVLISVEEL